MSRSHVDFRGSQRRVSSTDAQRQRRALEAILTRFRAQPGVILADEVGMGKTYVALGVVAEFLVHYPRSRVLVLTPSSDLAEKWRQDLERFRQENVPHSVRRKLSTSDDVSSGALREILSTRTKSRVWILPLSIFMQRRSGTERRELQELTYQLVSKAVRLNHDGRHELWRRLGGRTKRLPRLRRRLAWFAEQLPSLKKTVRNLLKEMDLWPFDPTRVADYALKQLQDRLCWSLIRRRLRHFSLVVVDEAHHFRNPDTQQYRAIETVFRGQYRKMLFLTATPFQLGPSELENMLRLFRLSSEKHARRIPTEAREVTGAAAHYQECVRALEEAWKRLSPEKKDMVCNGQWEGLPDFSEFGKALTALHAGHRRLQSALSPWVIRNVKKRQYRDLHEGPVSLATGDRLPFAILHRLIYEYERESRTFSVVQNLSLTSSWEACRASAVMRQRAREARSVRFYRHLVKKLLQGRISHRHPKLKELLRIVRTANQNDDKVLVFASRLESVRVLQARLNQEFDRRIYQPLRDLPRTEVDRRLRQLRKRAIASPTSNLGCYGSGSFGGLLRHSVTIARTQVFTGFMTSEGMCRVA